MSKLVISTISFDVLGLNQNNSLYESIYVLFTPYRYSSLFKFYMEYFH